MNTFPDSNIFEFNAATTLVRYGEYAQGSANSMLSVISTEPLSEDARAALASSSARLGFGDDILWVTLKPEEREPLATEDATYLLIATDPVAFVITDANAAAFMRASLGADIPLDAFSRIRCRDSVAFASFQEMLASPEEKQRAWALLKKLSRAR
ncbi:MAG: hypothetical protein HFJ65_04905 [Eggerthellaceae bacterium]|nr:hypothetical protein [Eggerthellaceae bacterium]